MLDLPVLCEQYFKDHDWPTVAGLDMNVGSKDENKTFAQAVASVNQFIADINNGRSPSMILLASSVPDDDSRTGCGVGKTLLAQIIFYATHQVFSDGEEVTLSPTGRFFEARELMAVFDEGQEKLEYVLSSIPRLIVIDDMGREGALRWEKRDPESQKNEVKNRYYTVINHCYLENKSLIITSNMSSRHLAAFLGEASTSRLIQMTPKEYRINLTGLKDRRLDGGISF